MGRQNETTIHEKRGKQNQKRDKNRPSTHHPSHTYDGALSPTIIYRSYYMAPLPTVESGEVQTTTIIGIILGLSGCLCCHGPRTVACSLCICPSRTLIPDLLVCFIGLIVSIWTISHCFPKRRQTTSSVRIFCVSQSCSAIDFVVEAGETSDVMPG
ncbi:hypothetical protein BKA83DRAFT_2941278 [Pisolithus microcarpus]|nr:hypothetical protein BKA83DRAFT_2941278 [Pisolithus microcarpus]